MALAASRLTRSAESRGAYPAYLPLLHDKLLGGEIFYTLAEAGRPIGCCEKGPNEKSPGPGRLMPANGAAYSRALGSRRLLGECCNSAAGRCFDAVGGEAHGLGDHPSESRPPAVRVARATAMSENISHPVTAGQHSGNVFDSGR